MPRLDDDRDGGFALARVPGRFYVSRRFPQGGADTDIDNPRICRFAYQVVDENGESTFESEDGWEIMLRETPTRQQLKALFFEDDRSVQHISFQRFNASGECIKRESFVLSGDEVGSLVSFLGLIRSHTLDLVESDEGVRLLPARVEALLTDDAVRQTLFERYRDAFVELLEADVDSPEVVAFARRRQELQTFESLLGDASAFTARRNELRAQGSRSGREDVWQDFFESNHWIFGTGLAPQFLHSWNRDRLEQTVVGASVFGKGKRPDALMRTAGLLSALVFVEIKTHQTPLLHSAEYRAGTWRVSDDVAGGVSQCQTTVDEVMRRAATELEVVDKDGFRTRDTVFVCRPRSLLVVGSLDQFIRDGEPHVAMFESFERFRRALRDPEIVTFDELFARAAMSLALADDDQREGESDGQRTVPPSSDWYEEGPF